MRATSETRANGFEITVVYERTLPWSPPDDIPIAGARGTRETVVLHLEKVRADAGRNTAKLSVVSSRSDELWTRPLRRDAGVAAAP
jgi:hypothetical protein